ncbi:MAG: GDP-mannose 4,6-dehydratase, partial [Propionicimonas sp.]|nr:GDP-mannose 4,6-dehydratase [Propionicimonas sp.]
MRTVLITGGAGFVGSNFIHYLLRKYPYRVVNLDLLTYAGNLESLSDIEDDDRYAFVRGDINNR